MARSHVLNLVHSVFSTKGRAQLVRDPKRLWACLRQIARNCDFDLLAVGGTSNHVHLLLSVPVDQMLVNIVRDLKANSSRFMREECRGFA